MRKLAYCGYCGREFLLEERVAGGSVPYCSAECLQAAAKQDAKDGPRPERVLISGRSPWNR